MGKIKPAQQLERIADSRVLQRFVGYIDIQEDGYWLWTGYRDRYGYGQFHYGGRAHWAHRVSYALFCESIESGLTVDHTCHCTSCVNPSHLELATHQENCTRNQHHERYQDKKCPSSSAGDDVPDVSSW